MDAADFEDDGEDIILLDCSKSKVNTCTINIYDNDVTMMIMMTIMMIVTIVMTSMKIFHLTNGNYCVYHY